MKSREALQRADVLKIIDQNFPNHPIVVTLGGTVREMVAVCGRRPNHLYVLDSMGLVVPVAFGLALGLAQVEDCDRVVVVEGDGSLLMGLSVLSTIGMVQPKKLIILVLDNGGYLTTGGQPSAAGTTDFAAVAQACGLTVRTVSDEEQLKLALKWCRSENGPLLIHVAVDSSILPAPYFLEDPAVVCEDFTRWLSSRRVAKNP